MTLLVVAIAGLALCLALGMLSSLFYRFDFDDTWHFAKRHFMWLYKPYLIFFLIWVCRWLMNNKSFFS